MYWVMGLLGVVLAGSPYLFGYSGDYNAMATSLGVGGVLVLLSAIEGYQHDKQSWEYWIAGPMGLGLVFAPFILGFSAISAAFWTSLIVGMLTIVAAGTKLSPDDSPHYG